MRCSAGGRKRERTCPSPWSFFATKSYFGHPPRREGCYSALVDFGKYRNFWSVSAGDRWMMDIAAAFLCDAPSPPPPHSSLLSSPSLSFTRVDAPLLLFPSSPPFLRDDLLRLRWHEKKGVRSPPSSLLFSFFLFSLARPHLLNMPEEREMDDESHREAPRSVK